MSKSYTDPLKTRKLSAKSGTYIINNYIITDKRLGRGSSATVYLGHNTLRKMMLR